MSHHRLAREHGAASVVVSLADELRRQGHAVTTFARDDAMQQPPTRHRLAPVRLPFHLDTLREFSLRARAFVEAHAGELDVVDALLGDLPFSKQQLGFDGLLVARSVGLYFTTKAAWIRLDRRYPHKAAAARRQRSATSRYGHWGAPPRRTLAAIRTRFEEARYLRCLQRSDLINVPNVGEQAYVQSALGLGAQCVVVPLGVAETTLAHLAGTARPATARVAAKQVVFIGAWVPSKGAWDWDQILQQTKARVPAARFLFLGTSGYADGREETVLRDLGCRAADWIEIVPHFPHEQLPRYLAGATVGAFPSYHEGFGMAVLEMLGAGLPTVAYDIPSMREIFSRIDVRWIVPAGAIEAFVDQLVALLELDEATYTLGSACAREVAATFTWRDIATRTVEHYRARAHALGHGPT